MNAAWSSLLLLVLIYALFMTVWNLMLMRLLDLAKADVRRLAADKQPVKQAIAILGHTGRRTGRVPAQRGATR